MNKKAVLALFLFLLPLPTVAAGAGVWTKPALVRVIFPRIFPLGGTSFPTFEFKTFGNPYNDDGSGQSGGTTCGETTKVGLRGVDGSSYDQQAQSLKSMQSGLFAAWAAGKKIRIRWDGSLCYANEIAICADDVCAVP